MIQEAKSSGGPASIRGYLVQTLVALLDIAQADPPFHEIVLEPSHGEDKFDFVWSNATKSVAVQVKSTTNEFHRSAVEAWAMELESARDKESCRLVLVGNYHSSLERVHRIGTVAIEKKNLDLPGLLDQAAFRVSKFMHVYKCGSSEPSRHEAIVAQLLSRLLIYSTTGERFTRGRFVDLLRSWAQEAGPQSGSVELPRFVPLTPGQRALCIWREKLEFLLGEEAVCVDPEVKFRIQHLIIEAQNKIRAFEGKA